MHLFTKIIILQLVIYSRSEGLTKDVKEAEIRDELLIIEQQKAVETSNNDTQDDMTDHRRVPRQLQAILPLLQQQVSQQQQGLSPLLSTLLGGLPVQQGQTASNSLWQFGGLPGGGGGLGGSGQGSGGGLNLGGLLGGGLLNVGGLVGELLIGLLGGGGGGTLPTNHWNGQPSYLNPWQLGNLGGLGQGGNQGGLMCPLTHMLTCRCEPLMSYPMRSYKRSGSLEILQHSESSNEDGSQELSATLSNGLSVYQRNGRDKNANNIEGPLTEGFYSLKLEENSYFNIHFTINDLDYTVKADVATEPPKSGMKKNV